MGAVRNFFRRAAGLKRDTMRRIDIAEELKPGRLIFADVGRHQPVQGFLHRMAWVDPVVSAQPTVEMKYSFIDTMAHYGRCRSEGKLDHLPLNEVALLRRTHDLVHQCGGSYDRGSETVSFEDRFKRAIMSCSKTIVDLDYGWLWEDSPTHDPQLSADYIIAAMNVAVREMRAGTAKASIYIIEMLDGQCDRADFTKALLDLRDAGAAVLYVRKVCSAMATYALPEADLHIIERYPLKNEYDDEVVLISGERVVIKVPNWVGYRRPEWIHAHIGSREEPTQTIAEYNANPSY